MEGQAVKPSKAHKKKKHQKHHHKKSHSKSKKTKGFLCCRGKKRKRSSKKHHHKKSKTTTKKQPRSKVVKPLPPVPNEQLGEIVLVKNFDKAKTPSKDVPASPDKTPAKAKSSKEKTDKEDKQKSKSKKDSESKVDKKDDKKAEVVVVEKKEEPKKEEPKKEEENNNNNNNQSEEKKQKWLGLAKRFVAEDAKFAMKDFQLVAGYIPPHVTKHHFVQNMDKNRFSDVVCLDHSRVALADATYIHANWVEISTQKKAILTQMPLVDTAADFWQMCIEQRVKCVLLLLTAAEYENLGGDFVFPGNQDFLHFEERSIRVGEFKRVEILKGWSMRVLSVTNGNYKSFLHVHHYTAWPHNSIPYDGSPQAVRQLWQLQSALRKYAPTSPAVYMSLSGCGRAGTFALFETAHASLHGDSPKLDIVKCLELIRDRRIHSCQTLSQFSFVYTLLAEHILNNGFCKLVAGKKEKEGGQDEDQLNTKAILRQLVITKCRDKVE